MKWYRFVFAALIATGLAFGCGGDDPAQENQDNQDNTNQQNDNQQNDNQQNTVNDGDDEFAEAVDVWVGSVINNEDNLTPLADGETFGGRFEADGAHYFTLDLEAGDVLTISTVAFEEDLEDNASHLRVGLFPPSYEGGVIRMYFPETHDQRQFFVTESGSHTIMAEHNTGDDERGEAVGFSLRAESEPVSTSEELEFPGRTSDQDLDEAEIDVFSFTATENRNVDLELFALRSPVDSHLDAWVYIYDPEAGEVVVDEESQSNEVFDPRLLFEAQADREYWVAVDMLFNVSDAAYEIETQFVASTPDSPIELSTDGVDSFAGTIEYRESAPYFEYFLVSVEPGEYKKFTAEGTDELQPLLMVSDVDDDAPPTMAQAVEQVAGVTLGVADDASTGATFVLQMAEERNLGAGVEDYLGGEGYEYEVSVEMVSPPVTELTNEGTIEVDLAEPGDIERIQVDADDNLLLWLDSNVDRDNIDPSDLGASGFLPTWALGSGSTMVWTGHYFDGYYRSVGESVQFYMRDRLFRGGPDYEATSRVVAFDVEAPNYDNIGLGDGNTSWGDADALSLPARVVDSFEDDGTDEAQSHFFSFQAEADDYLVVSTENQEVMEVRFTVYDSSEEEVADSFYLMEQFQQGTNPYFDTALVHQFEAGGTYYLEVEQACGSWGCDFGDIDVRIFID